MEPKFTDGEIIYIRKESAVNHGHIMAVQITEEDDFFPKAYLKIVRYDDFDTIRLISLNDDYDDIVVDAKEVTVIGVVVE